MIEKQPKDIQIAARLVVADVLMISLLKMIPQGDAVVAKAEAALWQGIRENRADSGATDDSRILLQGALEIFESFRAEFMRPPTP